MTNSLPLAQLYALRAHLDAVIMAVEQEAGIPTQAVAEIGSCPVCQAPEDKIIVQARLDCSKTYRCSVCKTEWNKRNQQDDVPAFLTEK